jgi:hypothetical protein
MLKGVPTLHRSARKNNFITINFPRIFTYFHFLFVFFTRILDMDKKKYIYANNSNITTMNYYLILNLFLISSSKKTIHYCIVNSWAFLKERSGGFFCHLFLA